MQRAARAYTFVCSTARQRRPESEAHFDLGISTNLLLGAAVERGVGLPHRRLQCGQGAHAAAAGRAATSRCWWWPQGAAETVVVETVRTDGDVRYWRDADGCTTPKRPLGDILLALALAMTPADLLALLGGLSVLTLSAASLPPCRSAACAPTTSSPHWQVVRARHRRHPALALTVFLARNTLGLLLVAGRAGHARPARSAHRAQQHGVMGLPGKRGLVAALVRGPGCSAPSTGSAASGVRSLLL